MLFDSHTHLNHDEFSAEELAERIREIEEDPALEGVVDIGIDVPSSLAAVAHAEGNPWCYATVGVHPHEAKWMKDEDLVTLASLTKNEKVVAVGEIGLDFFYDHSPRDVQREVFRKQIRMALGLQMPIVIHSREANQETMDILIEEGAFSEERKALFPARPVPTVLASGEVCLDAEKAAQDARVLIHCFSGSAELAAEYIRLGATISVGGPLTYKNNKKTVNVIRSTPKEFFMAETDAPFLTPVPYRGKPNKSSYIKFTVQKMAELKNLSFEEMAQVTRDNALRFYGIE